MSFFKFLIRPLLLLLVFCQVCTPTSSIAVQASPQGIFKGKIDSIPCIIVPATHEMVYLQIIVKGGVNNYNYLSQGIEPLLMSTIANGATTNYTLDEIELLKSSYMIQTSLNFYPDYSVIQFKFPLSSWADATKLIGDMLGKPAFHADDIENARGDVSMGSLTGAGDRWEKLRTTGTQIIYNNKNYLKTPWGDGLNLNAIQSDALKKLYNTIFNRNNISISVYGKVNQTMLTNLIKINLKWLRSGSSSVASTSPVDITSSTLNIVGGQADQKITTCMSNAPKPFSTDYAAFLLLSELLQGRISTVNQQKKYIDELQVHYSNNNQCLFTIQFTASDPDKAMQLIADEIKYLKKFGVKQAELNEKRVKFISHFYLDQSDDNWCQLLSLSSFYNTTVMIDGLDDLLQKVTVSDVQQAAVNYIKAFSIFYSGQKDEVNNLIFTQKLQ